MAVVARSHKSGVAFWVCTSYDGGKQHWERSGSDKREAERLDARRRKEVDEGIFVPAAKHGSHVHTFAAEWLAARTARSVRGDRSLVRDYVLSRTWFANLRLREVRPRHIKQLAEELRDTPRVHKPGQLKQKTASNIIGILRTMFRDALIAELVDQNPVVLPRGTLSRKGEARKPYSEEHARQILLGAGHPARAVWSALALYSGMREGEVCGRRWRDLSAAKPLPALTVETQYDDQPLKGDDNERARPRVIPVHRDLARILTWWYSRGFEFVYGHAPRVDDWIVGRQDKPGFPLTRSAAYKSWRKSLRLASVENQTVHATRHTFITLARRGGARPDVLETVTHNASGKMIDLYTHWEWAPLCEAVSCFPSLLDLDSDLDSLWVTPVFVGEDCSGSRTRT